ncbi:transcriptional regulator [Harryflintia acetispora]|uniref:Phage tail protein n=1 Tax=Harryflintia acetispora TaxID=1849041 RepID=A0A9X8UJ41_9FIRM|nr:transcriptional regulator [Harryflintia acetispora]TCL43226.1 hypothetical protein EDD78_10686 [Harryflintia acetispora]
MIFVDDKSIKVGGVVLPGLIKSLEISGEAIIDEQEVEGQTKKPKQATGYEDGKITLELILIDGPDKTAMEKLEIIQNRFRAPGQEKPEVYEIVNEHTAARGLKKVIFKALRHKAETKKEQIVATLEFLEYTAITITAQKATGTITDAGPLPAEQEELFDFYSLGPQPAEGGKLYNFNGDPMTYEEYMAARGAAPELPQGSPANDTASAAKFLETLKDMPY